MTYTTLDTLKHDFPALLTIKTPKGNTALIGIRLQATRYAETHASTCAVRYWLEVPGALPRVGAYKEPFGPVQRALNVKLSETFPDAVCSVGNDKGRVMLTQAQLEALEAEARRVLTETPEGQQLAAWKAEKEAAQQAINDERRRKEKERAVPLLHLHGSYGLERELMWGWLETDEECRAGGYRERRVIPGGGPTVVLDALDLRHPIFDLYPKELEYHGWTWGGGNCYRVTPEQWAEIEAANRSVKEARAAAEKATQEAEQTRIQAAFDQARETGKPQVLDSAVRDDDSIPDNSFSTFTTLAMPDGTTKVKKTPAY